MEERLDRILKQVNDWLKFAEAKNAAILTINSAIIFGNLKLLETRNIFPAWIYSVINLAICCIFIATIISLASFLPKLNYSSKVAKKTSKSNRNLIFFVNIAEYNPSLYLKELYKKSGIEEKENLPIEIDYAKQIIENSRVALKKYHLFSISLWITIVALFLPSLFILIIIIKDFF